MTCIFDREAGVMTNTLNDGDAKKADDTIRQSTVQIGCDKTNVKEKTNKADDTGHKLSILNDIYVDLLGSLVPGLFTVILGGTAIFLAMSTVHVALLRDPMLSSGFSGGLGSIIGNLHWEFATIIIVSAYVIGAVFFRQDPKKPDAISAFHVWMSAKKEERGGLAVQPKNRDLLVSKEGEYRLTVVQRLHAYFLTNGYIKKFGLDTQFPYQHLKCYLESRGLTHLAKLVPWDPADKETKNFRSKMYINILKIRLFSSFPQMSKDIIRNEAHVRLATSVWYSSTTLLYLSVFILIVLAILSPNCIRDGKGSTLYGSSSFALLLLFFCLAMRHHLRKCIHYMRVREVIYVLETAYWAKYCNNVDLFVDLIKSTTSEAIQNEQLKKTPVSSVENTVGKDKA